MHVRIVQQRKNWSD